MNEDEKNILLNTLSGILIRCLFMSIALLLLWAIFHLLAGDLGYSIHSRWFELSRHDYDLLNYYGMAFVKAVAILFFLFPYLSIRLIIGNKKFT